MTTEIPTELIAKLAQKMGFETLETRNVDALDFRDTAVWAVKEALEAAYAAGAASVAKDAPTYQIQSRELRDGAEWEAVEGHDDYFDRGDANAWADRISEEANKYGAHIEYRVVA